MAGLLVVVVVVGLAIWFFSQPDAGQQILGCSGAMILFTIVIFGGIWVYNWWSSSSLVDALELSNISSLSDNKPDPDQARSSRMMWFNGTLENNSPDTAVRGFLLRTELQYCDLDQQLLPKNCIDADRSVEKYFPTNAPAGGSVSIGERILVTGVPEGRAVRAVRYSISKACSESTTSYDYCYK